MQELILSETASSLVIDHNNSSTAIQKPFLDYQSIKTTDSKTEKTYLIEKAYESKVFEKDTQTYIQTKIRKSRLTDYKLVHVHKIFTTPNNNFSFDVVVRDLRITFFKGKKISNEQVYRFVSADGGIESSLAMLSHIKNKGQRILPGRKSLLLN
jgi:hypothetical protein